MSELAARKRLESRLECCAEPHRGRSCWWSTRAPASPRPGERSPGRPGRIRRDALGHEVIRAGIPGPGREPVPGAPSRIALTLDRAALAVDGAEVRRSHAARCGAFMARVVEGLDPSAAGDRTAHPVPGR